jgi:hypothetical protein
MEFVCPSLSLVHRSACLQGGNGRVVRSGGLFSSTHSSSAPQLDSCKSNTRFPSAFSSPRRAPQCTKQLEGARGINGNNTLAALRLLQPFRLETRTHYSVLQGAHLILPPWILEIFSEQVGLPLETWNVKEFCVNGP